MTGSTSTNSTPLEQELFQYTVEQLIAILKSMPQDLPVLVSGYETGFENPYPVKIIKLQHAPENAYYDGEFQETDNEESFIRAVVLHRVTRS